MVQANIFALVFKKKITEIQSKSIYIHCSNHSLDLVLQKTAHSCDMVGDALSTVKDVSKITLYSAKQKSIYANIVLPEAIEKCWWDMQTKQPASFASNTLGYQNEVPTEVP